MLSKISKTAAIAALLMTLTVAGCASTNESSSESGDTSTSKAQSSESSAPEAEAEMEAAAVTLTTADSAHGEIVVDAEGKTLYMFDKDTQGAETSACTGDCLAKWPPLTVEGDAPEVEIEVEGVTGEIGTITTADGDTQVTLNGWPLYYFDGDAAAGDVNGQAVGGVWWVLSPAGERLAE